MKTIGSSTSHRRRTKALLLGCLGAIALLGCMGSKLPDEAPADTVSSETTTAQPLEVPTQFQGTWNLDLESCSSGRGDGRLVIMPDSIRHYASAGPFTEVVIHSDSEITVMAELTESGYPPSFVRTDSYQLSDDHSELTDVESGITRKKCPDE